MPRRYCSDCGAEIGAEAVGGLCPSCLLELGLEEVDAATVESRGEPDFEPNDSPVTAENNAIDQSAAQCFGDYELLEEIGRGGMGVVFKARQVSLNRIVALKMIAAGRFASASQVQRFRIEAEAAANLEHPNIVVIYEVGEHEGQHYFTMNCLKGGALSEVLRCRQFSSREAVEVMIPIARAVHYAHQRGILHRDLKPGNILLDEAGQPYVTDFGLAKLLESDSDLTHSQAVLGTPSYMAPEQAAGQTKQLTTAADIFSLGAIFYELLTGRPSFQGPTPMETMREVIEKEPEGVRQLNPDIDSELERICLQCLAKDPQSRYGSAEELIEDLCRWSQREADLQEPRADAVQSAGTTLAPLSWLTLLPRRTLGGWAAGTVLAMVLVCAVFGYVTRDRMPNEFVFATAMTNDYYHKFGRLFKDKYEKQTQTNVTVKILESTGSISNRLLLAQGAADFALLQASVTPRDEIRRIGPLFPEYFMVLARTDSGITNIADLAGRYVSLGPDSGSRRNAEALLEHCGVDPSSLKGVDNFLASLETNETMEAGIMVANLHNPVVNRLLKSRQFRLIPLDEARGFAVHQDFMEHAIIPRGTFGGAPPIPPLDISTVTTVATLAAGKDVSPRLIRSVLESIYEKDLSRDVPLLYSKAEVKRLRFQLDPIAEKYFRPDGGGLD